MAKEQTAAQLQNIRSVGLARAPLQDLYHFILLRPAWQFVLLSFGSFLAINAVFATIYWLAPGSISSVRTGSFEDAFFFSVQTLGTIGYGNMYPVTRFGHAMVTIEAFIGILSVAMLTGVTFAKFARPSARVIFSARIAAPTRHGVPHLQFRMANQRQNLVVEAQLRVLLLVAETTPEGESVRRPVELKLVRDRTALFTLTWTAMHMIDDQSPFFGEGAIDRLRAQQAQIFLSLTAIDETLAQPIHTRWRYTLDDIAWNMRFADVLLDQPDGSRLIDYGRFDDVVPLRARTLPPAA